jgi:hypothetical protein
VAEAGRLLGMAQPNVAKFLDGRGFKPFAERSNASGRLWLREDVLAAKTQYENNHKKQAADQRRRTAMREPAREKQTKPGLRLGLGATQRSIMEELAGGPSSFMDTATRLAARRLMERGYVEADGRPRVYRLTDLGRKALESFAQR